MSGGNETRGEITLDLGGETFGLRPSYEAIDNFERVTGKGLIQLTRDALSATLSSGEVAHIVCECMKAWGTEHGNDGAKGANAKKVAKLVLEADGGVTSVMLVLAQLLSMASTGGYTASGEVKPAVTTKSPETPAAG